MDRDKIDLILELIIFRNEGGDKLVKDEGGLTKFGISQGAFPYVNIEKLTLPKARSLYLSNYVARILHLKIEEPELFYHVLDHSINCGVGCAIKGFNHNFFLQAYKNWREEDYKKKKNFKKYEKSWLRRVNLDFDLELKKYV